MSRRAWLACAALLVGCGHAADVDVCAPYPGRTCVALRLASGTALLVDQVSVAALDGFTLAESVTPSAPRPQPAALPILLAVLPPAAFVGGNFDLRVKAMHGGVVVGTGMAGGAVAAGAHATLTVPLSATSGACTTAIDCGLVANVDTARCVGARCDYDHCTAGAADLDGNRANGCEATSPITVPEADTLELWLAADRQFIPTGPQQAWLDLSPQGHNGDCFHGLCPTVVAGPGGRDVLDFDGSVYLTLAGDLNRFSEGFSFFAVINPSTTAGHFEAVFEFNETGDSNHARITFAHGGGDDSAFFQVCDPTASCPFGGASMFYATGWSIYHAIQTLDGKVALGRNGVTVPTVYGSLIDPGNPVVTPAWSTPRLANKIGWSNTPTNNRFKGQIAELVVYRHPLAGTSTLFVESYLRAKWGLP